MNAESLLPYDVFISHSPADREWVAKWLVPRLEAAGLRVAVRYRDFVAGQPEIRNVERLIEGSRRTVAVITPEWLASEWNALEDVLVRSLDPAARHRRLIPILLRPAELPEALAAIECIDLTAESLWETELKRLTRDLGDVPPVAVPWRQPREIPLRRRWMRWLRRYRRQVRLALVGAVLAWVAIFTAFAIWPFQNRPVWLPQPLAAGRASAIYNTDSTLLVGAQNPSDGCNQPHKGLWFRELSDGAQWQDSAVDDLLCIPEWKPGQEALSDIQVIASPADNPGLVYALTSHSGVLVSRDGGRSFEADPAGRPPLGSDNPPLLLALTEGQRPAVWVTGEVRGLLRYAGGAWTRLDRQGGPCAGLQDDLTVGALLTDGDSVLIGSQQGGLWLSNANATTCRLVFDPQGRYTFRDLSRVPGVRYARYLALVEDTRVEPDEGQGNKLLLDLCPRPTACTSESWRASGIPLWQRSTSVADLLVDTDSAGQPVWYVATDLAEVWQGDLAGGAPRMLPRITRCLLGCVVRLASSGPGKAPYLLSASLAGLGPARVYQLEPGPWWRRIWS